MSQASYGVSRRMPSADTFDEAIADLRVNGFTVLESGIDSALLSELKDRLDAAYLAQVNELGGEDRLQQINDADIVRCVLAQDPLFLRIATSPSLMTLASRLFGSDFVLTQQNGIINRPDRRNNQIAWHRDLPYQHWTSTSPIAINALFCLDAFTLENGATFVLPASHHVSEFPTEAFVIRNEKQLAVPAGSFLVLDAMLYHRGGVNRSSELRRAVNHVIGLPFMAQQVDIPSAIATASGNEPQDANVRKYLGYRWSPAKSGKDWRERRLS